jgi:hypothetical protein
MAIFLIALAAVFPILSQAGRNLAFAQDGYAAHLRAQHLMLLVRETLPNDPTAIAQQYSSERGSFPFTAWLIGGGTILLEISNLEELDMKPAAIDPFGLNAFDNRTAIVVAVWNEHGNLAGWAIGWC